MAKRSLKPPEVIASTKNEPALPRRQCGERPKPIADELNRQRQRPTWDEKRP
jgi:hypothetical protein